MENQKTNEEVLEQFTQVGKTFEENYHKRIRNGLRCMFFIPVIFMVLMFSMESKLIFLTLWIVSILVIAAYLIAVEYIHCRLIGTMGNRVNTEEETEGEKEGDEETTEL